MTTSYRSSLGVVWRPSASATARTVGVSRHLALATIMTTLSCPIGTQADARPGSTSLSTQSYCTRLAERKLRMPRQSAAYCDPTEEYVRRECPLHTAVPLRADQSLSEKSPSMRTGCLESTPEAADDRNGLDGIAILPAWRRYLWCPGKLESRQRTRPP